MDLSQKSLLLQMVGIGRFDEERNDEEPEQSEGNPATVSNPIFCITKKTTQKEKVMAGKFILQSHYLLFAGIDH